MQVCDRCYSRAVVQVRGAGIVPDTRFPEGGPDYYGATSFDMRAFSEEQKRVRDGADVTASPSHEPEGHW